MTPGAPNDLIGPSRAEHEGSVVPLHDQSAIASFLPTIPDHELLKKIGGGSYGEVWLARSTLGTYRAVKIVHRTSFEHERPFEREFQGIQKFEPVSRSHEGLVDLLQVGRNEQSGYFYYVMELADDANENPERERGCPKDIQHAKSSNQHSMAPAALIRDSSFDNLSESRVRASALYTPRTLKLELARRGRLPLEECIQLGLSLSSALGYLHQHGLVHRDIKPSNIIFVAGAPKLADVGLVAGVGEARSYVGTEGFIPPEGPGTPQADLYSLGIVLYQMSTGKNHQDFPEPLADLAIQPDHTRLLEFNAVIHKACHSDPRHRYENAEALQAELALLKRGDSVRRKHSRQRWWIIGSKMAVWLGALALVVVVWQLASAFRQRNAPGTESVRLYELGRSYYNQMTDEGFQKAIEYLNQAIKSNPDWVSPYIALFEVSGFALIDGSWDKRFELQKQCARKLMALAPRLGESHAALSWVMAGTNNWNGAESEIKHAIALSPNYAHAYLFYGSYLTWYLGRVDESVAQFQRAHELDPNSPIIATALGFPYFAKRQFPQAIAEFRKALELRPNCGWARMWIGKAYEATGDYVSALAEFEALDLRPGADQARVKAHYADLRRALLHDGPQGYWRKVLDFFQQKEARSLLEYDRYGLAGIYARLGDKESALKQLKKDAASNDLDAWLVFDPAYDSLRNLPEFKAIVRQAGLKE